MEYLSECHLKLLLSKEWLVKVDHEKSTPYLLKFYSSTVDLCCCILITDTRNVWGEVLTSKQFARRWRDCNPESSFATITAEEEDEWRSRILDLLATAHSLGGIMDLSFEVVDSHNADLAVELGSDRFRWRWETYSLGPKVSADVLSKHLILPLISATHLAFGSADPVSELSAADLEKAVDKTGRTARRTLDTHIKHAISKPRVATTLQRMTAIFNFMPILPPIFTDVERPELVPPVLPPRSRSVSKPPRSQTHVRESSPDHNLVHEAVDISVDSPPQGPPSKAPSGGCVADSGSETEQSEGDHVAPTTKAAGKARDIRSSSVKSEISSGTRSPKRVGTSMSGPNTPSAAAASRQPSPMPPSAEQMSPPPAPPAKRAKRAVATSSNEDGSEEERKEHVAQSRGGTARRGPKQPIKRGGRRF
ncbi:hypothetical protein OBBRIDRAFT_788362 [Obba rivulosa]|uniref:XLF-like N-terminal domain-containing protein n=1 Tax=Obba rivulosa TaxID=1052685 RepID=A0A8E2DT66_9APHY|nr:hypothetical protein OBBRIDRAFT_788362 [Obba rivulosa]